MSDKEVVIETLRQMPEAATLEQISEEIAILTAIHKGEAAAEAGQVTPHDKVRQKLVYPSPCSRCGSTTGFRAVSLQNDSTGGMMLIFGGFIPYLLYTSSRSNMVACEKCGFVFRPQRASNWKAFLVFFCIAVVIALIVVFNKNF